VDAEMKTLEDIIEALENCLIDPCPDCTMYINGECQKDKYALKYLKEYRMMMDDIVAKRKKLESEIDRYQEAVRNCEEVENKYRMLMCELEGFPSNMRMNIRW
jgi:hypothetical protein